MKQSERNRNETERRILDAVTGVTLESGIKGLGVNRVAEKAGCSKMLIYRYFCSFDGLLERWAEENNYWIKTAGDDVLRQLAEMSPGQKASAAAEAFRKQIEDTRKNPVMRELIRWQLSEENVVCSRFMALAEERGLALTEAMEPSDVRGIDVKAVTALITAGINYLALQADFAPVYNGVSLDTDEGWMRIGDAAESLVRIIFNLEEKPI